MRAQLHLLNKAEIAVLPLSLFLNLSLALSLPHSLAFTVLQQP